MTHVNLIALRVYNRKQTFWLFRNLSYTKEINKREDSEVTHFSTVRVIHPLLVLKKKKNYCMANQPLINQNTALINQHSKNFAGILSIKHLKNLIFTSLNIWAIYFALSLDIIYILHVMPDVSYSGSGNLIFWNLTEIERLSSSHIFLFIGRRDLSQDFCWQQYQRPVSRNTISFIFQHHIQSVQISVMPWPTQLV